MGAGDAVVASGEFIALILGEAGFLDGLVIEHSAGIAWGIARGEVWWRKDLAHWQAGNWVVGERRLGHRLLYLEALGRVTFRGDDFVEVNRHEHKQRTGVAVVKRAGHGNCAIVIER